MKAGNSAAKRKLWERYYSQLVNSVRAFLSSRAKGREMFDEEDVLQSVFFALFRNSEEGKFPDLSDRTALWRLLIVMAERRVLAKIKRDNAIKRGGGKKHFGLYDARIGSGSQLVVNIPGQPEPIPETTQELVAIVEEVLGDCGEIEKQIAIHRMQGYELKEIAEIVGKAPSTVNRKLTYLKNRLRAELD